MDTGELRALDNHEHALHDGMLQWSLDDQWLVSIGYDWSTRLASLDFDIVSLDGQVQPIPLINENGERITVLSTAWIPRGWLQLEDLPTTSTSD